MITIARCSHYSIQVVNVHKHLIALLCSDCNKILGRYETLIEPEDAMSVHLVIKYYGVEKIYPKRVDLSEEEKKTLR